jgi:hypothetical protein
MKATQRLLLVLSLSLVFSVSALGGETQGPSAPCVPGETNAPPCEPAPEMRSGDDFGTLIFDSIAVSFASGDLRELLF